MTYDEISRLSADGAKRDLRETRRKLATALELIRSLNNELDAMLEDQQRHQPCPNCTCSDCLPPEYLANLQIELEEMEAADPNVKAAVTSYEAMVRELKGEWATPDEPKIAVIPSSAKSVVVDFGLPRTTYPLRYEPP